MSREDFFRIAKNDIAITPDTKLVPSAIDAPGSNLNILMAGASAMAEECDARSAARFAASLSASATDTDLDRLILERTFNRLPRLGAAAAVFAVQVSRTGTNGFAIPAGTTMDAGGFTWSLDAQLVFQAGQAGPLPATFTCQAAGSSTNIAASLIGGFTSPAQLNDPTATISALASDDPADAYSSGGADAEKDADYRARFAAFDAGLDRNEQFIAAGALSVPGVTYALAIADAVADGRLTGTVSLYVGDINGRANRALRAKVRAQLRGFRLAGQEVGIFGTVPSLQTIVLSFAVATGFTVDQVEQAAMAAVLAYVNALKPGEDLNPAGLYGVLKPIPGLVFVPAHPLGVVTPATTVAAATDAVIIRTTAALISVVPG